MAFDQTGFPDPDAQPSAPVLAPPLPDVGTAHAGVPALYLGAVITAFLGTLAMIGAEQMAVNFEAAGPDLARLLLAMAGIKALLVVAVAAVTARRLLRRASPMWIAAYSATGMAMAIGLGCLVAQTAMATSAVLLHAGLVGSLVLLHRDRVVHRWLDSRLSLLSRDAS